jgi:type II secretory pathway pseudopilin PulG
MVPASRQSGFTVIEVAILLVVCLIAGVVTLSSYLSAKASARDAQRISDVKQLQKALKYHYEEFGYYPQDSNGVAVGVDNSFSRFVSPWPTAPKPADGRCSSAANSYAYEQLNSGENYQIRFCLGGDYGGLKAGVRIAMPDVYQ